MSDYPSIQPDVSVDIINITKNSKGFRVQIKPIENLQNIESYRIYLSDYIFSIGPNTNPNSLLIKEIRYSSEDQYFYHVPRTTGVQYLTIFAKNKLGLESTGILFSGEIPFQNPIKEIAISNLNYYTDQILLQNLLYSGGMINAGQQKELTVNSPYAYLGWQLDNVSPTTQDVQSNSPEVNEYSFATAFKDESITFYQRVIPAIENNSGILIDNTLLRANNNDVFTLNSASLYPDRSFRASDLNIQKLDLTQTGNILTTFEKVPEIISQDNRYFLFDFAENYQAFIDNNVIFVQGTNTNNDLVYNPEVQSTGSLINQLNNLTGASGEIPTTYISVSKPGHYNSYYVIIEAVDSNGNSSAGGNINSDSSDRYTNEDGYKIVKINHNKISRNEVTKLFKNYYRQDDKKLIFEFKDLLPSQIGLDSVVILPTKYSDNINSIDQTEYYDKFIFLRNLKNINLDTVNSNYKIESLDDQNGLGYRITCTLSPDSLLLKDNIFSVKLYYLNSLEAEALNLFLQDVGYNNQFLLTYLNSTDLLDKYITLNKFIKDNKNYTSTIAASYQGLVYFFTPESYPYISWPNEDYRNAYLNKDGARMLDFEKDGFATGPQFFDYFPQAQAKIDGIFPNDNKYKTTYRCLDSYKYSSSNFTPGLDPEDVPTTGINGSPSYLGVYDPGNIGDVESPQSVDFKYIKDDLKYFSAKNIYAVKLLSVGIQKDDAYAIVEFVLDIPDAQDFIVQGISGTDTILEKGIKEINGINFHYFVAKFVSSCGVDTDPILNGEAVDVKSIVDSKKMVSFLVYPTKFKLIEDPTDVPFFGDFYLLASDIKTNQFNIIKTCPNVTLTNSTDCVKGCCVDEADSITRRSQYKQFYILSQYIAGQTGNNYPYGKICDTDYNVFGSTNWRYKAVDYTGSNIISYYKKPTNPVNSLSLGLACYPEHNVGLNKVIIYMKQTDNPNSINWQSADIIDSYLFNDVVKGYPIYLSIPDFSFSNRGQQAFEKILKDYNNWVAAGKTFSIKIVLIDNTGDTIEQNFVFENNESC
jgi:hypothetical protein